MQKELKIIYSVGVSMQKTANMSLHNSQGIMF